MSSSPTGRSPVPAQSEALLKAALAERPHRLFLYLPSQRRDGSPIEDFEEIAGRTAETLAERFGGVTSYPAVGHFNGSHGIQKEPVRVLEFYCPLEELAEEWEFLHGLVLSLHRELSQESMALSVNGSLLLFSGNEGEGAL